MAAVGFSCLSLSSCSVSYIDRDGMNDLKVVLCRDLMASVLVDCPGRANYNLSYFR